MLPLEHPDRIQIAFDDHRLVANSARLITLHLPQGWPWEKQFSAALARLRAIPLPA